jgi:general stress protein YciG
MICFYPSHFMVGKSRQLSLLERSKNTMASKRGFAAMDPAKVRELASKGGKVAHQQGVAHEFTSEEARLAGRKGGRATHLKHGHRLNDANVNGSAAPTTGEKVVDVACSSAGGCVGTVNAGSPEAAEAIGKPYVKAPTSDEQAVKDGSSADEDPTKMGSCGSSGGCGSSKS